MTKSTRISSTGPMDVHPVQFCPESVGFDLTTSSDLPPYLHTTQTTYDDVRTTTSRNASYYIYKGFNTPELCEYR